MKKIIILLYFILLTGCVTNKNVVNEKPIIRLTDTSQKAMVLKKLHIEKCEYL